MQRVVIDEPYVPVPPKHSGFWPRLLWWYLPHMLRRQYGIQRCEFENAERLRASVQAGHGIVLATNHCRDEDPLVLAMLSRDMGVPIYVMASWHLFRQNRVNAFFLPRAGVFSVYREGIDRAAISTAVDILEKARRPLIIFPEGFISRTNDRLGPLLDGTGMMARTAAKKRAKQTPPGKVVVHPIAIRYTFHGDIEKAVADVLDQIETRLTWQPQRQVPMLERLRKVGEALLALKEIEYLQRPQTGSIGDRLQRMINAVLEPLENEWAGSKHDGDVNARVKRLRTAILPDMVKGEIDEAERQRRWRQLADAYFAQQLHHYPPDYLRKITPERLLETVERFEEDVTDRVRVHGPISAKIMVGEAIEVSPVREARGSADPLTFEIERQLRAMLGLEPPIAEKPEAVPGEKEPT